MRSDSDGEILRRAREDPRAFADLYRRYEPIVAGYLARQTRDPELTADLTAETFATALLKAGRFRGDREPAAGWLLGIARHLLLETKRRGRAETRARRRLGAEPVALSDASYERVEALIDAADPDNPVVRALDALPPAEREVVRARVLEEASYVDLARRLGVPQATVRQRVSRGLARMRFNVEQDQT